MQQMMSLQDRGDDVRLSIMRGAYEVYDEPPATVEQWYDPRLELVAMDLPGGADLSDAVWTDRAHQSTMRLQYRGDAVRVSLTARAYDRDGRGIPDTVEQWYNPKTHIVAFELFDDTAKVPELALYPSE
jgi:hypothetical protein